MKYLFCLFFFLISFQIYPQDTFKQIVVNPLLNNPVQQEKIFIHSNKTSYFSEDSIWFKVYTGSEDNTPSLYTTVMHVILRDFDGTLLKSKKIFIHKGVGNGEFILNSYIDPGTYFIQAYTQNALNFDNDFVFTSKIEILGKQRPEVTPFKNKYDIQILPEGGYLLENTLNTIGIKSLLNGKGVDFSGKIIADTKKEITSFSSKHLGMGKCQFFYEAGKEYNVQIKLKDTLLKIKVPKAREKGISLGVDNSSSQNLKIVLRTNKKTLKEANPASYVLLYHQRNRISGYFEFSNLDSLQASVIVKKSAFFDGVNTVSLFKDNKPIAERKFYIEKQANQVSSKISNVGATKDSIIYKIELQNRGEPLSANLSASILSKNPKNFEERQTIESAFLLTPFVNGFIENPAYYFNKKNNDREAVLDLLLLTQGWTSYSLNEMIAELNPRPTYAFENGISLNGTINGILSTNNLGLITNKNLLVDQVFLNGKKEFQFNDLLLYKGDTIKFSFLDRHKNALKPKGIVLDSTKNTLPKFAIPKITTSKMENDFEKKENTPWLPEGTNLLEEVNLFGEKRSERFRRLKKLQEKYKPLVWDIGKYYEVPLPNKYKSFKDNLMAFLNFDQNVELVHTENGENYLKVPINKEAALYVNGGRIKSFELNSLNIAMENIETIMVQPIGRGNRVYQVFTTENYKNNIKELFAKYVVRNGFDKAKQYYQPLYNFDIKRYQAWKEIDWKPNIQTNAQGEAFIKIPKSENKIGHFFSLQGFSEQGLLISETTTK